MDVSNIYGQWHRTAIDEFDKQCALARTDLAFYDRAIAACMKRGRMPSTLVALVHKLIDILPLLPPLERNVNGYMNRIESGFNIVQPHQSEDEDLEYVCIPSGSHVYPGLNKLMVLPPCAIFTPGERCLNYSLGDCAGFKSLVDSYYDGTIDLLFDKQVEILVSHLDLGFPVQFNGHLIGEFGKLFGGRYMTRRGEIIKLFYRDYIINERFEAFVMNPVEMEGVKRLQRDGPWIIQYPDGSSEEVDQLPVSSRSFPNAIVNSKGVRLDISTRALETEPIVFNTTALRLLEDIKNDMYVPVSFVRELALLVNRQNDAVAAGKLAVLIVSQSYYFYFSFYDGVVGKTLNGALRSLMYMHPYNRNVVDSYRSPVNFPAYNLNAKKTKAILKDDYIWREELSDLHGNSYYVREVIYDPKSDRQLRLVKDGQPYYEFQSSFYILDASARLQAIDSSQLYRVNFVDTLIPNVIGVYDNKRMFLEQKVETIEVYGNHKHIGFYNKFFDGAEFIGLYNAGAVYYNDDYVVYVNGDKAYYLFLNNGIERGAGKPVWAQGMIIHGKLVVYIGHLLRNAKGNVVYYYNVNELLDADHANHKDGILTPFGNVPVIERFQQVDDDTYITGLLETPDIGSPWYFAYTHDSEIGYGKIVLDVYQIYGLYFFELASGKEIYTIGPTQVRKDEMDEGAVANDLLSMKPRLSLRKPPSGISMNNGLDKGRYVLKYKDGDIFVSSIDVKKLGRVYQGFSLAAKMFGLRAVDLLDIKYVE